jgi:dCMP deaminase
MTDKNKQYFDMAEYVAEKFSKDTTKVGCLLIDPNTFQILSTGYNGIPRKVEETENRKQRPEKYYWFEHAERNALYHAARHGIKVDGATAYITMFPCADCARGLIQAGIKQIFTKKPNNPTWEESFKRSSLMLKEAGIEIIFL